MWHHSHATVKMKKEYYPLGFNLLVGGRNLRDDVVHTFAKRAGLQNKTVIPDTKVSCKPREIHLKHTRLKALELSGGNHLHGLQRKFESFLVSNLQILQDVS